MGVGGVVVRIFSALFMAGVMSLGSAAQAQEVQAEPVPAARAETTADQVASGNALERDPEYQRARRLRLSGILLTTIGGGVSAGVTVLAGYLWAAYTAMDLFFSTGGATAWGVLTVLGAGSTVGCLAAGIALWVVGGHRMRRMRESRARRIPFVGMTLDTQRVALNVTWVL